MTKFRFLGIVAGAVALAAGFSAHAADPSDCPSDAPTAAAQRIAIDPRTGMIMPAPPASAASHPAVRSVPLAGVRLQSGATRVDLKGRYQMAVVAHRNAAGAVTTTCEPAGALPGKQEHAAAPSSEVPHEE